eukprot:5997680-Amphidinium_carterae.1
MYTAHTPHTKVSQPLQKYTQIKLCNVQSCVVVNVVLTIQFCLFVGQILSFSAAPGHSRFVTSSCRRVQPWCPRITWIGSILQRGAYNGCAVQTQRSLNQRSAPNIVSIPSPDVMQLTYVWSGGAPGAGNAPYQLPT